MPGAAFHSYYWSVQAPDVPIGAGASSAGGYVPWQTSIIAGSGLGALQIAYEWLMARRGRKDTHGDPR
jgi:hypothetical protein